MNTNSMRNSRIIVIAAGVLFVIIILFQFFSQKGPSVYQLKIDNQRLQKNAQFKGGGETPIKPEERANFKGLAYFEPNEAYKLKAKVEKISGAADTLSLTTTTGEKRKMTRVAILKFELVGKPYQLVAYNTGETSDLFVPFKDMTSNVSTYAGGRYLDVPYHGEEEVELDFNLAYNPYCVYNDTYSCPLPPTENKLKVEIFAGEKMWK